ncbi:MAG: histidine kinase [Bacteroidetes bacterium]|nr:histidine kinase [Bacteroidota bacterium]
MVLFTHYYWSFPLIFIFIKNQLNIQSAKQEEKSLIQQKLVELQQKALASNLNPHFIFNSLNSIQHFINSHHPVEANEYLSKFSRLMRMQLNMADKSLITLHEEISRIEFYLSLEQMRFGEKLTWQIHIDPAIDVYTFEIPNMIIQPFIENAIWHGIMPSSIPGNILLNMRLLTDKRLEISVTDNGVGYGQNKSLHHPEHESKGVNLITERLILLDSKATNLLVFEKNNPGTKVIITLTSKMYRNKTPIMA